MAILSPPSKGCGTPSKWPFKWLINGGYILNHVYFHWEPILQALQSKKSPTGPTERTPNKPVYLIDFFRNLPTGPLGPWVLAPQFLMDPRIPHWVSLSKIDVLIRSLHTLCACALAFGTVGWPKAVLETGETS